MSQFRVFDLFSGIGGFSIALNGLGKAHRTVAYCDKEETCRKVLRARIKDGKLHDGPIFEDIKEIKGGDVKKIGANTITAGFPCVDISVAKPDGKGISGEKSGLFKEVLRIIDESDGVIHTVFLENSSNILNKGKGYKYIKREMTRRGFAIRYVIISAHDVGAYHRRKRWYCICSRLKWDEIPQIPDKFISFPWKKNLDMEGKDKVVLIKDRNHRDVLRKRCAMLGNSIVPQCAMLAWNLIRHDGSNSMNRPITKPETLMLKFSDGDKQMTKDYWATPVFSIWHFYGSLTNRGSCLLSNQMYYHDKTIVVGEKKDAYRNYTCNPRFVEALMGYQRDWTRF